MTVYPREADGPNVLPTLTVHDFHDALLAIGFNTNAIEQYVVGYCCGIREVAQSRMRLFSCTNSPHAAFSFLCSGGQKRLFESPSDAPEQKKDIPARGFESRMRLLRNVSIMLS